MGKYDVFTDDQLIAEMSRRQIKQPHRVGMVTRREMIEDIEARDDENDALKSDLTTKLRRMLSQDCALLRKQRLYWRSSYPHWKRWSDGDIAAVKNGAAWTHFQSLKAVEEHLYG